MAQAVCPPDGPGGGGQAGQEAEVSECSRRVVPKDYENLSDTCCPGLDDLQVQYSHMFNQPDLQDYKQLQEAVKEVGGWAQDACENVLLSMVLLFCPDMIDLLERRRVEEIQLKFATLLQKYLNQK